VELRNDQVDPKEHEQAGEPKQDIAEREDQSARAASFDLILAAETRRMPLASKIVKITDSTELRPSWPDPRSQYAAGADVGGGKSEP